MTQAKQPNLTRYLKQASQMDTCTLQRLLANLEHELSNRSDFDSIYISWNVEDVQSVSPDLTTDQCRAVLRHLYRQHDAEMGITWDVIRAVAGNLYPTPRESGTHDRGTYASNRIATLNDLCRKAMGVAGKLIQTEGINLLCPEDQSAIREKVENFSDFTEDNDPHGERDFGTFEHNGKKIFWKIDYYAPDLMHGSEDPADATQTVRVLTIMLAEEY